MTRLTPPPQNEASDCPKTASNVLTAAKDSLVAITNGRMDNGGSGAVF